MMEADMTREEIIEALKIIEKQVQDTTGNRIPGQDYTVIGNVDPDNFGFIINAARRELQKPPAERTIATVTLDREQLEEIARNAAEEIKKSLQDPEACTDAISRSEALRAFWNGEAFPRYLQIAPAVKPAKAEEENHGK